MASNNETVAEIVKEMLEKAGDKRTDNGAWLRSESVGLMLEEYADAVNSAHEREIAAKDAEIAGLREKMGDDDLLKMARDIDKLNAKLKVAEDALEYAKGSITRDCTTDCDHLQECIGIKGCLCEQRINNALATIRGEGGAYGMPRTH